MDAERRIVAKSERRTNESAAALPSVTLNPIQLKTLPSSHLYGKSGQILLNSRGGCQEENGDSAYFIGCENSGDIGNRVFS